MIKAGIKETRQNLTGFLRRVEKGEEVIIMKRGEKIAKISPLKKTPKGYLASHKALRNAIASKGKPLSKVIVESRKEERF
jgi:prevent-host-death family protein